MCERRRIHAGLRCTWRKRTGSGGASSVAHRCVFVATETGRATARCDRLGRPVGLSERATLDCAWRRSDLDASHTVGGVSRVGWRDGNREPRLLDLAATRAKLRRHGLRLSLRYAFGGEAGIPGHTEEA